MERLLRLALRQFIHAGNLRVTTAGGTVFTFGDGSGPPVAIRFTTRAAQRGVLLDPELKLGEAYMDGDAGHRAGLDRRLPVVMFASAAPASRRYGRARNGCGATSTAGSPSSIRRTRSRRNVAHHYDLDEQLYSLFLDADRQYSCAYFETPDQSLDDAQLAKKRHIAAKLLLEPGKRVLDIGCGWGGLALYLAELCRRPCHRRSRCRRSSTRSRSGARIRSGRRRRTASSACRIIATFRSRFDRIVSVGMFEHVGVGFYDAFFRKCA